MRKAIEEVCDDLFRRSAAGGKKIARMEGTHKFAESIRPEVLKKVGADSKARGYSIKMIKGEIQTILKERRNGSDHS